MCSMNPINNRALSLRTGHSDEFQGIPNRHRIPESIVRVLRSPQPNSYGTSLSSKVGIKPDTQYSSLVGLENSSGSLVMAPKRDESHKNTSRWQPNSFS